LSTRTALPIVTQRLTGLTYSAEKLSVLAHAELHSVVVVLALIMNLAY